VSGMMAKRVELWANPSPVAVNLAVKIVDDREWNRKNR
jgi:hypothetical protein